MILKILIHFTLLTEVKQLEEVRKKYEAVIPTLIKDEHFTILKYDTQVIPEKPQEEE